MKRKLSYNAKPTLKQKKAVDNILSGEFRSVAAAMRDAGYSEKSSFNPKHTLANRSGVQEYVESLSRIARKRWDMSLPDKVMETYLDGLEATKLYTRKAIEHPDYVTRLAFANTIAEFFGWIQSFTSRKKNNIVNFFGTDEKERMHFNKEFSSFTKRQT